MSKAKKKNPFVSKLRSKYRIVISRESTFEEVLIFRFSRLNVLVTVGIYSLVLIGAVVSLVAFTKLREFIPGYPDGKMRQTIISNALLVDSLESELYKRGRFIQSVQNVISGNDFDNLKSEAVDTFADSRYQHFSFSRSVVDSIFRKEVEEDEKYSLAVENNSRKDNITGIHFFAPLRGVVTSPFDAKSLHYGTDIVAADNERISAVLSGTVIFSEWTLSTGYVIQIQHENNLVSVYKHNSDLLKRCGESVKAGEIIALIGDSGEFSTGPHLHFELWHNGKPLDPEDYIKF